MDILKLLHSKNEEDHKIALCILWKKYKTRPKLIKYLNSLHIYYSVFDFPIYITVRTGKVSGFLWYGDKATYIHYRFKKCDLNLYDI